MSAPRRVALEGIAVNLRVEGSGPPLLFLGGSNFDMALRAPVFDSALPRHFTVAAADPRGLGGTDAPEGDWTMKDYARDAEALLDALGWPRAFVLGESFGAMTAVHLAGRVPERIEALALCAGAPGGAGGRSHPIETLLDITDPQARACAALSLLDSRFRLETADQKTIRARMAFERAFQAHGDNASGYRKLLAARAGHDARALLKRISAPTLIFAGRFDRQAPPHLSEAMAKAMPHAALRLVEGGHNICFASPVPVATIIRSWATQAP